MYSFERILELSKKLRAEGGCPWDAKQTLESLKKCLTDETQEICEGIDKNDMENVKEEIGDVMFTLCMMMNIASEKSAFTSGDVFEALEKKIVSRHTWVFGEDKATTAEEALALWKANKLKEKLKN